MLPSGITELFQFKLVNQIKTFIVLGAIGLLPLDVFNMEKLFVTIYKLAVANERN